MKFVYPWMLALVALVPVAGAFWAWQRARAERRLDGLVARPLRRRLLPGGAGGTGLQAWLIQAGLLLIALAASRPQWGHSSQKTMERSRNVVVAMDVSRSMLAQDVRPNRLERAKADVADLIDALEGDRCALVAFRRTGVLLCPLTTDRAFLRSTLEGVSPESAPRGETDLGSAIKTALDALDPADDGHNAVILVSDGGDLRGGMLAEARAARKRGVPVFTVGLGNPKADSTIPDASGVGRQQYQGKAVATRLEEKALAEIARESGGSYVPLATAGTAQTTLGAIYRRFIRLVEAKDEAEAEELRATERFGWFLVPGLLLVIAAGALSRGRFAGRCARAAAAAAVCAVCAAAPAEETNSVDAAAAPEQAYEPPGEARLTDGEVWNRGYDLWKAGDYTNALATLKPLLLSRTHGARAAEVVGALEHAKMKAAAAEDPVAARAAAEEAAAAMQIALRASPDDPRANRNFTRATDRLAELREAAHVATVLKESEKEQLPRMLAAARKEALAIFDEQQGVFTNEPARAVAQSESLAKRTAALADRLIPLKRFVAQSVTNEQQAAHIIGDIESTRDAARKAVDLLEDMAPDAADKLSVAESAFYRYWKTTLEPPVALGEGLRAQTNAFAKAERENGRDWQAEALGFTQLARAKLQQWAQQACAQDAPTASNAPPFTVELAAEVAARAEALEKEQAELAKTAQPTNYAAVLASLRRLHERCGMLASDPRVEVAADIVCQSNAFMDVASVDGCDWQRDALDHTRVFRAKFPAWAQRKEQEIQQKIQNGNTNAVPFTKETQAEIASLAAQAEAKQSALCKTTLPPEQQTVLDMLNRIRELLPKDDGSGGGQQNQQQQQQQQQQDKKDDKDQQQGQDKDKNDQDQQQEEKKPEDQKQKDEPKDLKEVEELLRKAKERSDEHENEKKARMRNAPLSPNDRDW